MAERVCPVTGADCLTCAGEGVPGCELSITDEGVRARVQRLRAERGAAVEPIEILELMYEAEQSLSWYDQTEGPAATAERLTKEKLERLFKPPKVVVCAPGERDAVQDAVDELIDEGYVVSEVRESDFCRPGTVHVLDEEAK